MAFGGVETRSVPTGFATGSGVIVVKKPQDAFDRIDLILGEMQQGNDSDDLKAQLSALYDYLFTKKKINKKEHSRLMNTLI